jgi:hypothetical protein
METLTTGEYIFDGKAASRLSEDLPLLLRDARPLEGAKKYMGKGTDCNAVLMEYAKASFVAYEMEIARLNGITRRPRDPNTKLQSGHATPKGVMEASKGSSKNIGEFSDRHLPPEGSCFVSVAEGEQR